MYDIYENFVATSLTCREGAGRLHSMHRGNFCITSVRTVRKKKKKKKEGSDSANDSPLLLCMLFHLLTATAIIVLSELSCSTHRVSKRLRHISAALSCTGSLVHIRQLQKQLCLPCTAQYQISTAVQR